MVNLLETKLRKLQNYQLIIDTNSLYDGVTFAKRFSREKGPQVKKKWEELFKRFF
jgi:hypothetical protein